MSSIVLLNESCVDQNVDAIVNAANKDLAPGGGVSAVTSAVERVTTNPPCKIFNSAVISNPSEEMINIVEMFKARRAKK